MGNARVHADVISDTPGRLRVRLRREARRGGLLLAASTQLERQAGVGRVDTNGTTGSITIKYDRYALSTDDVLAILQDAGVTAEKDPPDTMDSLADHGHCATSDSILGALTDLDRRLSRLTGRKVDLKLLFPLTLAGVGLRQWITQGLGLAQVPAYVLLWYAFDSFWKFHRGTER